MTDHPVHYNNRFYIKNNETDIIKLENEFLFQFYSHLNFDEKACCDFGCGTGYWTEALFNLGATIIGTDISAEMLNFCFKNNTKATYVAFDEASKLRYDYIFINWVFQEIVDNKDLLNTMEILSNITHKGSKIFLVDNVLPDPNKAQIINNDDLGEIFKYVDGKLLRFFSDKKLESIFRSFGFSNIMRKEFGDSFICVFEN